MASSASTWSSGRAQVAFSASLVLTDEWTHQGPFEFATTLVFRKVVTNIGNAYNPETGGARQRTARGEGVWDVGVWGGVPLGILGCLLKI